MSSDRCFLISTIVVLFKNKPKKEDAMAKAQNIYFPFFVRRRWEKDTQIIPYFKINNLFLDQNKDKDKKYLVFYNKKNIEKIKQIKTNRYIPFVQPTNDFLPQTTFVIDFDLKEHLPEITQKIVNGFSKLNSILNGKCLLVKSSSGVGWHIIFVANGNIEPKNYQQLQKDIIQSLFNDIQDYIDFNASLSKKQGFYHLAYFPEWIENGYINITKREQGRNRNFWTSKIALDSFEIHSLQDNLIPFEKRDFYRLDNDLKKTIEFIERASTFNNQTVKNQYASRFINIIGCISQSSNFQIRSLLSKHNISNIQKTHPLSADFLSKAALSISRYTQYYREFDSFLNPEEQIEPVEDFSRLILLSKEINFNKSVNKYFGTGKIDKAFYFESEIKFLDNLFIDCLQISLIKNPEKCLKILEKNIQLIDEKQIVVEAQTIKRFIKFVFEIKQLEKKIHTQKNNFILNDELVEDFLKKVFENDYKNLSISKQNEQTLKKIWRVEKEWLMKGFKQLLAFILHLKMAENNLFIDIGLEDFKQFWNTHERKATALRQLLMPSLSKDINEYKAHWKRRGFMIDWKLIENFCSTGFVFTPQYLATRLGNGNTWSIIRVYAKPLVINHGLHEACKIFNEALWLSEAKNKKQRIREFALFARKISRQLQEQRCKSQVQTAE